LSAVEACIGAQPEAQHHLILGNHDPGHPMHRSAHRNQAVYLNEFQSAQAFARRRINKDGTRHEVMLSHFPYQGDHGEDRYPQYRLVDLGKPIIHGHTHSTEKVSFTRHNTLQVHVGVDAWRRPVRLEEIAAIIHGNGRIEG
jgi:calcineurin-like phosphoesterase family protein